MHTSEQRDDDRWTKAVLEWILSDPEEDVNHVREIPVTRIEEVTSSTLMHD